MLSPEQPGARSQTDQTTRVDVAPAFTCQPGDLLCDRFRVLRVIARGGMGELYEAEDLELHERVALKTIRQEIAADERMNQRFRREVQLARKVTHPNICRIFDLFQHQPGPAAAGVPAVAFVTMEFLDGETLSQKLKRDGRLSSQAALPLVRQMAAALSAAHGAGVVHRDFKSNNVMLLPAQRAGEPARVVVTDFGLAYSLTDAAGAGAETQSLSVAGEIVGTPDYMAPEQLSGEAVTPATDIFALGVVLYEMVTGARPFAAETPMAAALRRLSGPPPRAPRDLVPDLSQGWNAAIMRSLERRPRDRFPEVASIVSALDADAGGQRRRTWQAAAAVLVGCALVAGAGWFVRRGANRAANVPTASASAAAPSRQAVAVLGFRNLAGREDVQWLSTALAEMLTTDLAASESLRTVPGENIDRMKVNLALREAESYGAETLARIRQNLGTDLIILGSYVVVGEGANATLRVDIRLQDARSGQSISAASETGSSDELLDLVSRAARHVREGLGAQPLAPAVVASVKASQPASREAARLYAEGLIRLRRFDALAARDLLDRAIQEDSRFPLAHAALASTWATLGYDERALQSAKRAFELSPNLSREERLVVEGTYREMARAWKDAIGIWQTLSTFFPDDIEYVLRLANAQIESGDVKSGIATIERFRQQFPQVKDPRLEIAEATAAATLSDFKRAQTAAAGAAVAAERQGATLLVAAAKLSEGGAVLNQGHQSDAILLFEEARRLYTAGGDRAGAARAINSLATVLLEGPDPRRAVALYEEGLATARAVGQQSLVARILNNLAIQDRRAGNLQASLERHQQSLAIRREIGDRTNTAISLNNIGNVLLDLADPKGAVQHYEESAAMSREIGDRRGLARALHNDAEALLQQGNLRRARAVEEEALSIRRGIDDPASVATSLTGLAQVAAAQGELAAAKRLFLEGLAIDRRLDRRRPIAYDLYRLGEIAFVEGNLREARQRYEEALEIRTQLGEKGTAAESNTALGVLALEEGRYADAEALTQGAAAVFEGQKASDNEAVARAVLALALQSQGRSSPALREMASARALVRNTQNAQARMQVMIAAARLDSANGNRPAAARSLESVRAEAAGLGIVRHEFDARRALVETSAPNSPEAVTRAAELKRDAEARGLGLYAAVRRP